MSELFSKTNSLFLGNKKILELFRRNLDNLQSGKGSVMLINGTKGIGKSRLLQEMSKIAFDRGLTYASVQLPHPSGNIALSDLKPFSAFSLVIEDLARNKRSANLQLVSNVGLTLLASLPIAGDFFYATKEIKRDIKEYRKSQSKKGSNNDNFLEVFEKSAKKANYLVLIDDFHFSDVQSFSLLKDLINKMPLLNIMFVLSFDSSSTLRQVFSLRDLIKYYEDNREKCSLSSIESFDDATISEAIKEYFPQDIISSDIFNWFLTKTHRNPLALFKYLDYFKENQIPLSQISTSDVDKTVPEELHNLLMIQTDKLTEEEKNILSVCATVGYEFPVSIVSSLMKIDVLTTIRKLRSIQNRTGIIVSLGTKTSLGEKVTFFQFSQPIYKEHFAHILEYEEKKELHLEITSLLKQIYDKTEDPVIRNSILPYLISHGTESENKELIEELLINQIEVAKENNDFATLEGITSFLDKLKNPEFEINDSLPELSDQITETAKELDTGKIDESRKIFNLDIAESLDSQDNLVKIGISQEEILFPQTSVSWEDLIELSLNNNDEELIKNIEQFLKFSKNETDKIKASLLLAKLHTEAERFSEASRVLSNLNYSVNHSSPTENDILFLNAKAILEFKQGRVDQAIMILQDEAAPLSMKLGPEYKLLTLSNIAIVLKEVDFSESQKYGKQVIKQARILKFDAFLQDFQQNYA